jgi:IS5 family transposase
VIKKTSCEQVIVDTTVMPKAIAHPTDSRLLEKSRQHLVKAAKAHGLKLRQNYNRCAPRLAVQDGALRPRQAVQAHAQSAAQLAQPRGPGAPRCAAPTAQLPEQARQGAGVAPAHGPHPHPARKDKNKLYALHAPEVECIAKGKARTPYEFGVKVSIATTFKEGLVVGMRSMPGNPYDGHTLAETLEQVGILTGADKPPKTAIVDKGYQGVEVPGVRILRSGQKRGITKTLKAMIKRRSAVEPTIGHMKMDGRLARNPLKGALGDAIHAVMCGAGHNLRLILAALRLFCARLGVTIQEVIGLLADQLRFAVAVFA